MEVKRGSDMKIILHFPNIEKISLRLCGINKSYFSHYNKESKLCIGYVHYPKFIQCISGIARNQTGENLSCSELEQFCLCEGFKRYNIR